MSVQTTIAPPLNALKKLGLSTNQHVHYQLGPDQLTEQAVLRGDGVLNDTGALLINTGKFTGRSPKDKFTVKDSLTESSVHWNDFNIPIEEKFFFQLKEKMLAHLSNKETWVRDCYACAEEAYRLRLRVINENPWSNLFCYNMFIRPEEKDLENFEPNWHIIQAPSFKANPAVDGTRAENFAVISFTHKTILIGGTGYTGEMKKGIFNMLNFVYLPKPMY